MTKSGKYWDAPRIWRRRRGGGHQPPGVESVERAALPGDAREPAWRRIEMLRERQMLKRQLADIDDEDPEFEDTILQPRCGWREPTARACDESRVLDDGESRDDDGTAGIDAG